MGSRAAGRAWPSTVPGPRPGLRSGEAGAGRGEAAKAKAEGGSRRGVPGSRTGQGEWSRRAGQGRAGKDSPRDRGSDPCCRQRRGDGFGGGEEGLSRGNLRAGGRRSAAEAPPVFRTPSSGCSPRRAPSSSGGRSSGARWVQLRPREGLGRPDPNCPGPARPAPARSSSVFSWTTSQRRQRGVIPWRKEPVLGSRLIPKGTACAGAGWLVGWHNVVRVLLSDGASHRNVTVLWSKTMQSYKWPTKLQSKGHES